MYPNQPAPAIPPLQIGDIIPFVALGPRHQIYLFDYIYVQRGQRRYYCKIINARLQPHTTRTGRRLRRYIIDAEVRAL